MQTYVHNLEAQMETGRIFLVIDDFVPTDKTNSTKVIHIEDYKL